MSSSDVPPTSHHEHPHEGHARPAVQSARSNPTSLPPGHNRRSEDSWIEVSSQPSSSSLSSAAPDEIITEGLRVRHDSNARRRRRLRTTGSLHMRGPTGTSSQEEFEESESESDRVLASSNEGLRASLLRNELRQYEPRGNSTTSSEEMSTAEDDDDDENSTAVNYPRGSSLSFRPQPNAFTHPPTSQRSRTSRSGSYSAASRPHIRANTQRYSYPSHRNTQYNVVSPSYRADQDEVLRASLSTLLSLGAAARGLPKSSTQPGGPTSAPSTRIDTTSIRMVPESVALGDDVSADEQIPNSPSQPTYASRRQSPVDQGKRKSSPISRSSSKDRRSLKKTKRTSTTDDISPTLFTWAVTAGVMVLFSAISFSAGYMVGKEAGKAEMISPVVGNGADAGRCGREAASGFKRLRWGVTNAATGVRV